MYFTCVTYKGSLEPIDSFASRHNGSALQKGDWENGLGFRAYSFAEEQDAKNFKTDLLEERDIFSKEGAQILKVNKGTTPVKK